MRGSILITAILLGGSAFAMRPPSETGGVANNNNNNTENAAKSAACAPAQELLFMDFNNVRALIETGGSMWQNRSNGTGSYFVPENGEASSIYAGALWMGGTDVNGQLKLAAHLFRQGNDFWAGPLESLTQSAGNYDPTNQIPGAQPLTRPYGDGTIGDPQCLTYDKFFTITKADVIAYVTAWRTINEEGQSADLDAEILDKILNWPAHPFEEGQGLGQDHYLAPFYDRPGSAPTQYNPGLGPDEGDYPWYDLDGDIDCADDRRVTLFGDITNWWVFNDKGNIHTETGADPIGMEVRAQAFAFATTDEINDMTFYNYEMVNRGTQRLENTYFAQYVDPDLGGSIDDFVGCDVTRGLGFCYNGDQNDEGASGAIGYGTNPPAVGIDFFEGPYQDNDNKDNVGPVQDSLGNWTIPTVAQALADDGIVYNGIGIGYGDGIIDNERFGMRRFTFFNRAGTGGAVAGVSDDPSNGPNYYAYMTGFWKNGERMKYGGLGTAASGATSIDCDYLFPGDSDSLNWGTAGIDPGFDWDETQAGNPPGDRRFVQAAGPFTLEPGAVNNITVGVVWARSNEGDLLASVRELKRADTKAQALFDACFQIVEPPQAPLLEIQELENELVLYLTNPLGSNNYLENYIEEDKINIVDPVDGSGTVYDKFYRFEGYQIYQLIDDEASVNDIGDNTKARLVAQCDINNEHAQLVNWELDEASGVIFPEIMTWPAEGDNITLNQGIRHSFKITKDKFALGDDQLVNHKTYYYVAVAYGVNQYKVFDPTGDGDGQQTPFLRSRLDSKAGSIKAVPGIPHNPTPEADGTFQLIGYGDGPEITRIEGTGNGGREVNLTQSSIDNIVANDIMDNPVYEGGQGPIDVKVVDPLNVKPGRYVLVMDETTDNLEIKHGRFKWSIERYTGTPGNYVLAETISSDTTIEVANEQIIPDWGISVNVEQFGFRCPDAGTEPEQCAPDDRIQYPISATISFADSSKIWLSGLQDTDADNPTNWISSGTNSVEPDVCTAYDGSPDLDPCNYQDNNYDNAENFENLIDGTIAPYKLVNNSSISGATTGQTSFWAGITSSQKKATLDRMTDVDIVVTSDKSKWTRASVIEMSQNDQWTEGNKEFLTLRGSASVDKQGRKAGEDGYVASEGDLTSTTGMGWFPGYAIDVQTGERLNIVFGENSAQPEGRDMIWNPGTQTFDASGNAVFGGMHTVYVFRTGKASDETTSNDDVWANYSDRGAAIHAALASENTTQYTNLWEMCSWVWRPMGVFGQDYLATDVKISLRIQEDYNKMTVDNSNNGFPKYEWTMDGISTVTSSSEKLAEALEMINVVPNPYFGYSQYERDRVDTRIKIVNLPERCEVKIFNTRGKLVRAFSKDDPLTSLDWDLKNRTGIPIAGGVYIIHVEVPGIGEKIVKWFGGLREPDLENL